MDRKCEWTQQGWIAIDDTRGLASFGPTEREAIVGLDSVTELVKRLAARWAEWHSPTARTEPPR